MTFLESLWQYLLCSRNNCCLWGWISKSYNILENDLSGSTNKRVPLAVSSHVITFGQFDWSYYLFYLVLSEEVIIRVVAGTGSTAVASAVRVLHLGAGDHHGHGVMLSGAAGARLALPSTATVFRVAAGARVEIGASRTARWLLDARSWNHVVRLSL